MKPAQLAKDIRIGLFADRGTDLSAAMQYAANVFDSFGVESIRARTALHVVLNTLANILDEMGPAADNPAAGLDLGQFTLQMDRAALDDIIDTRVSMWFLNNVEAIDERVENWIADHPEVIEERVEGWMDNNFDAEEQVRDALESVDLRISVR